MLSVEFSTAFNTISPMKLEAKHSQLHYNTQLDIRLSCNQIGSHPSSMLVPNTVAPQGCVLSPLLFTLHTYDCIPRHHENSIVEYADNTTLIGCIKNNDETLYREEINKSCKESNPLLNVSETKELTVDLKKNRRQDTHPCLHQCS